MASFTFKSGRGVIQFYLADPRKRLTVSLGKLSEKKARIAHGHIEKLIAAALGNADAPRETVLWLADCPERLHAKLVRTGLAQPRGQRDTAAVPLAPYVDGYIAKRTDAKPRTIQNLKQTKRWLVRHFGEDRDIRTITRGDAADWHRLIRTELSQATSSGYVKKARQVFEDAVDRKLIAENPLKKLKAGAQDNDARQEYVTEAIIRKVIDATSDKEWRLIFALARWGGLRIPSETNALRWSDVRWDDNRILITSPKTEHHRGKESREIPLFPELTEYLLDLYHEDDDGEETKGRVVRGETSAERSGGREHVNQLRDERARTETSANRDGSVDHHRRIALEPSGTSTRDAGSGHVFTRLRAPNLRTQANRIIDKAGVAPWPKTFVNLRSSRQTDLEAVFPSHVVCAWIGNSPRVARKHYLQTTDEHFARGAAFRAAASSGKDRKETEHREQDVSVNTGKRENPTPATGERNPAELLANLQSHFAALQISLQSAHELAVRQRVSDIAILERAIAKAKAGGHA